MAHAVPHLPRLDTERQVVPAVVRQEPTREDVVKIGLACFGIPRCTIMECDSPAVAEEEAGAGAEAYEDKYAAKKFPV